MQTISIKRIKVNFQVRFGYYPELTDYIKTIPKDQVQTKMNVMDVSGKATEDWFRICNIAGLSKILWFCWDNKVQIIYENVKDSDIKRIEDFARTKKERYENALSLKSGGFDVSNIDYSFMKLPPYEYQKEAVQFFEKVGGVGLLGDSPGIGKSLVAIAYAVKHKLKTLIICPASLKLNWRKEILKFTHEKSFIFKYKPKKKENTVNYSQEESMFHIVNYESLDSYLKFEVHHKCTNGFCDWEEISYVKKYKSCPKCFKERSVKSRNGELCKFIDKNEISLNISEYDLVVLDECHMIKESKTHRTKIVKMAFKKIPRKILLSGTAIKNRPYEFFSLLNFLDEYEWFNQHNFGVKYCDGNVDKFDHWHYDGSSNLEELYSRISYLFLRRLKKDVLKHLPPKTYTIIPIELSPEETRLYNNLEKNIIEETNEKDENMTHLARIQKLKQFTSKVNAGRAIDFIQNIIDGEEKIIVFTQFLSTADFIYNHFKECAVLFNGNKSMSEKNWAVEEFMNNESCKVFVGTIGAAGVGITLTSASTCLFIDRPWEPGGEEQCEDRCIAQGQLIMTKNGFKKVEDIQIGDMIYTSLGNWSKITDVWNKLERKKAFFKIKYLGFSEPLIVTEDHELYVYDMIDKKLKYIEAKNLNILNHYLVFSNPCVISELKTKSLYINREFGEEYKNSFGAIIKNSRIKNPSKRVNITNKLMYALGWYLAEGWSCVAKTREKGSFVAICGNATSEKEKVELIANIIIDKFGLKESKIHIYNNRKKNCYSAYVYSKNLANFFITIFGHTSKYKKIPEFVFNTSKSHIKSFLRGYYEGDGYKRENSQQASTKSDMIAIGLCQLESLLGNPITLRKTSWGGWSFEYTIREKATKMTKIKNEANHVLFPITEININRYKANEERVYDLTTENDESFTVGLASVHNCHRVTQTADNIQIIKMICQNTIDVDINDLLESKKQIISKVLDGEYTEDKKQLSIFHDLVKIILNKKLTS